MQALRDILIDEINNVEDNINDEFLKLRRRIDRIQLAKEQELEIERELAKLDAKTGLYQGMIFTDEVLPRYLLEASGEKRHLDARRSAWGAVWSIDCDGFGNINNTHGHPVGDKVIKKTAEVLRDALRKKEVALARWGDEFGVLQKNMTSADSVLQTVYRVRDDYRAVRWSQVDPCLSDSECLRFSVGVVALRLESIRQWRQEAKPDNDAMAELSAEVMRQAWARADDLMYRHKDSQRNDPKNAITFPAHLEAYEFRGGKMHRLEHIPDHRRIELRAARRKAS